MSKQDIFSYLTKNVTGFTVGEMILNLSVIFVITLFIFAVYKLTTKSVNYYSNFAIVIMLTAVVTGVIMMIIESDLALSLGMVGALSIVRFRSAIKDPVDTTYIFWAVAVGISAGTGNYMLAGVSSLFIGIFVVIFSFISQSRLKEILIIRGENLQISLINETLKSEKIKFAQKSKSQNGGVKEEYIFEISGKSSDTLMEKLGRIDGIESVNIVSGVNI